MGNQLKHKKGFTLLELIASISIIAILSSLALPRYVALEKRAKSSIIENLAGSLQHLVNNITISSIISGLNNQKDVTVMAGSTPINTYFGVPQEIWKDNLEQLFIGDITYSGNGYYDFDSSRILSYQCTNDICLIDQTPVHWISDSLNGWGMFMFLDTYTLADNCYAYYAFEVDGNNVSSVDINAVTSGC